MSAVTYDVSRQQGDLVNGTVNYPIAASVTLYQGALCILGLDGYVYPYPTTGVIPAKFLIATIGYTGGATDGAETGDFYAYGVFKFIASSISVDDVGKTMYAVDNNTIDDVKAVDTFAVGVLVRYNSATEGWVDLNASVRENGEVIEVKKNLTAATVTTGGAVLSFANPFGGDAIVEDIVIDLTTVATGEATIDVGVAANGTTSSDTLLDGLDAHTATGYFTASNKPGTKGGVKRLITSTQYITATASATLAGLVGTATITMRRART